uniref:Uncharacterized protein n=1 Tax=Romanomermis culicivorax TaxID=13658 RepID=A0A915KPX1_ROMCU
MTAAAYQAPVRSSNHGSAADPQPGTNPLSPMRTRAYTSSHHRAIADHHGHSHYQSQSHCNNDQYDSSHDPPYHRDDHYNDCNNYHSYTCSALSDQCQQCHY